MKQKGNALIFILIAIALLGLLTVTLSRSGDSTNETGSFEQNQIAASEILTYAKSIENAVQMLLARGCSENDISFENNIIAGYVNPPDNPSCKVFDAAGAGMTWEQPSPIYTGAFQLAGIETNRADLLMLIEDMDDTLCAGINRLSGTPVIDEAYATPALFTGSFDNTNSIGTAVEVQDARSGCFEDTNTSTNVFFLVLHAR